MPLDYALATSHVRTKAATSPGTFADDPDVADPTVELPTTLTSGDPVTALAWRMPGRSSSAVKLQVTFRESDGTEVAGTFTAYAFVVRPLSAGEAALGGVRRAIEKLGTVAGSSATPMILDELGLNDVFGLRLSGITAPLAPLATRAFIHAEEV